MKKLLLALGFPMLFAAGAMFASADTCINLTQDMGVGATDATTNGQVTILQNYLYSKGFIKFKTDSTGAIIGLGTYGSQTASAVKKFQSAYSITPTGYMGPLSRSNLSTLTCAIGTAQNIVNQVVDTASTTNPATSTLLTFSSPMKGDFIVKGEKDIAVDWTLSPEVTTTFPIDHTRLEMDVIDTNGQVIGDMGRGILLQNSHGEHRISGEFQGVLKHSVDAKNDNIIPSGVYKLRASLVYTPSRPLCTATLTHSCVTSYSAADQALIAKAASYGSDSAWFYVVDPAPKPVITISASETTLTKSAPVTITWSASPSGAKDCTFTDVIASTTVSVSPTGSKVVTPIAATSTYKVTCSLTSEWPFAGNSYTTNADKSVRVFITSQVASNTDITLFATEPRRSDGRVSLTWNTTSAAPVALDMTCPVGVVNFTTNKGNAPTCDKGGVYQWSDATTSGSINITPSGNTTTVPVTFTATVLKRAGGGYIYTESKQQVRVVFPATSSSTTTTPVITSVSPTSAPVGTSITLNGSGFTDGGNSVLMDYTTSSTGRSSWIELAHSLHASGSLNSSETALTFTFPTNYICPTYSDGSVGCAAPHSFVGTHTLTVKNANGDISNQIGFTVTDSSGTSTSTTSTTLAEPTFVSANCSQAAGGKFRISLRWNRVTGATNYPVRLMGPSYATNAVQFNGESVVGFNNPGVVDSPAAPTGTSYTFEGLTATGTYSYWWHAWAPSSTDAGGTWSANTMRTVTCGTSTSTSSTDNPTTLRKTVKGAFTECVNLSYNMHRGAESPSVQILQDFLVSKGYLDEKTGFYGDKTVDAVKAYQASKGLPQTGMVYGFTRAAIVQDSCQ